MTRFLFKVCNECNDTSCDTSCDYNNKIICFLTRTVVRHTQFMTVFSPNIDSDTVKK